MKRFLIHTVCFCLLIAGLLWLITAAADKGLRKTGYDNYQEWNDIFNSKINADIIIQGNSHAWVQISPKILDSVLGTSSYNFGMDFYLFDIEYARYKAYRKRNPKPKIVIQCVDYFVFNHSDNLVDKAQFLPYTADPDLFNALMKVGMPVYYRYLPFLKYQENSETVMRSFEELGNIHHWPSDKQKGYEGKDKHFNQEQFQKTLSDNQFFYPEIDEAVIKQFEQFLNSSHKEGVQVVMVFTPHYYQFRNVVRYEKRYKQYLHDLAQKHQAIFLDYGYNPICNDTANFYNGTHLNAKGAAIFSTQLANDLKPYLPHK